MYNEKLGLLPAPNVTAVERVSYIHKKKKKIFFKKGDLR